jgi:hypothetical protein
MSNRRRKLESAVVAIQRQHGAQAIRRGADRPPAPPMSISTSFPQVDELTGCKGIPLGNKSLLSGPSTSGKVTLAYKLLANAQARNTNTVALVDLGQHADPDYLQRCGIDLSRLLLVRPAINERAIHLILDLARSRQTSLVVVDSWSELLDDRDTRLALGNGVRRLPPLLRAANCGVVFIDEINPLWKRWLWRDGRAELYRQMAVHIELQREQWLAYNDHLNGYRAQVALHRSRWAPNGGKVAIEILFNGTVRAASTG